MKERMPCITTGGKYFLLNEMREVLPEELMILQGVRVVNVLSNLCARLQMLVLRLGV